MFSVHCLLDAYTMNEKQPSVSGRTAPFNAFRTVVLLSCRAFSVTNIESSGAAVGKPRRSLGQTRILIVVSIETSCLSVAAQGE